MSASLNSVVLMGNLTRDPELRQIAGGSSVCSFNIAVNRTYIQNNEKKEEVLFIRINVWGKRGESCNEYLKKGSQVLVEGRLQSRSWEDKDGSKRSAIDVIADNVQFMSKPKNESKPEESQEVDAELMPDDDCPF